MTTMTCSCCGGKLPDDIDAHDEHLTQDGDCPGHVCTDGNGRVLGCGAWDADAYTDDEH